MKRILAYSPPYGENYLKEFETYSFMHSCGIDTVKLILSNSFSRMGIPYSPYPPIWQNAADYDFNVVDQQIADILRYNPEARFIAMIDLNSPPWLVKTQGRDSFQELGECFLDSEWLRQVSDYQEALAAHLEKRHSERVVAYYVACGRTQEWFDMKISSPTPLKVANYEKWCRKHGRTPLAVPNEGEFEHYSGILPEHLVQWREYGNSLVAECAAYFFRRLRHMVRPGIPIGGVFGNVHDLGSDGHLASEWFFREASPDFYIGPSCNSEIPMGGASGFQSAQLLLRRYGIGYLHSCDRQLSTTETDIGPGIRVPASGIQARQKNAAEDVACLKREFALAMVHGFSLWFFNIWGGSYRGEEVRAALKRFGSLWKEYAGCSSESDAETLLVFSPEASLHCRYVDGTIGSQLRRLILPEAGIPFTTAVMKDLCSVDLSPFRMVVFLNADYLEKEDLRVIRERVCRNRRMVVWCGQPDVGDLGKMPGDCRSIVLHDLDACIPEAFRAAGREAGLHFFTDEPGVKVWSSPEFLSVHVREGGVKKIRLKRRARRVQELFSGCVVGEDCEAFSDDFSSPDTKLYHLEY